MPQMRFDLLDGKEPVSFTVTHDDCERMMAFMAECTGYKHQAEEIASHLKQFEIENKQLKTDLFDLQMKTKFNRDPDGLVSVEEYIEAIQTLLKLERLNCGTSRFAAQVLLGLYNSHEWHVDLVGVACSLDSGNRHAAIVAILGRGQLMTEPHELFENGDEIFNKLWQDWKHLHVSERYIDDCKRCNK